MKKIILLILISFALFGASDKKVSNKKNALIMSEAEGRALVKILPLIEKLGPAGRTHLVEALRLNNSSIPKLAEEYLPKLTDEQKTALNQILAQMKKLELIGKMHLAKALDIYYTVFPLLNLCEQDIFDKIFAYAGIRARRNLTLTRNLLLIK